MKVRVIDYDPYEGTKVRTASCNLSECFDALDPEYLNAQIQLTNFGSYWAGGGAGPLVRIERIEEPAPAVPAPRKPNFAFAIGWIVIIGFLALCWIMVGQFALHHI